MSRLRVAINFAGKSLRQVRRALMSLDEKLMTAEARIEWLQREEEEGELRAALSALEERARIRVVQGGDA